LGGTAVGDFAAATTGVSLGGYAAGADGGITINGTGAPLPGIASSLVIKPVAVVAASSTTSVTSLRLPLTSSGYTQILVRNPTTGECRSVALDSIA